jgi:hypothetical protein
MKRDLEIARETQSWLVPEVPPIIPGFNVAFATRPADTVAGDYYVFSYTDERRSYRTPAGTPGFPDTHAIQHSYGPAYSTMTL